MCRYSLMVTMGLIYLLTGCGGAEDSSPSADPAFAPDPVAGLNVMDRSTTAIILEWDREPFAESYNLYRDGALIASLTDEEYIDINLEPNRSYSYQVSQIERVFGDLVESAMSNVLVTSTLPPATTVPAAPISIRLTNRTASEISLRWSDASDNEEGYNVYRNGALVDTVFFTDRSRYHESTGLMFSTDYNFEIRAFNDAGESAVLAATYTTLNEPVVPVSPTGVSVAGVTANSVTLNFIDGADNEDGYMIFIGNDTDPAEVCYGVNLSTCTIGGLLPATDYTLSLAAFVIVGESSVVYTYIPSQEVTVQATTQ